MKNLFFKSLIAIFLVITICSLTACGGGDYYTVPAYCRSARRFGLDPTTNDNQYLGFRVALVPIE